MSGAAEELEKKISELNVTPESSELQPEISDAENVIPEASGSVQLSSTTKDEGAEEFQFKCPIDQQNPTEVLDELGQYAVTENPENFWLFPDVPASSATAGTGTKDEGAEEFPFKRPIDQQTPTEVLDELGQYAVTENSENFWDFPDVPASSATAGAGTKDEGAEEFQFKRPFDQPDPTEAVDELGQYAVTENPEYYWLLPNVPTSSATAEAGTSGSVEASTSDLPVGDHEQHDPGPQIKCIFHHCDSMFYSPEAMLMHIEDHCNPAARKLARPTDTFTSTSYEQLCIVKEFFDKYEKKRRLEAAIQRVHERLSGLNPQEMPQENVRPKHVRFGSCTIISEGLNTRIPLPEDTVLRSCMKPISESTTLEESPLPSEEMSSSVAAPTREDTPRVKRRRLVIFCAFQSCYQRFHSYPEMHMHFRTHKSAYICTECWRAFGTAAEMNLHDIRHMQIKPYQCSFDLCGRRFQMSADLGQHTASHYDGEPYICPYILCGERFATRDELADHIIMHMGT